MRCCENIAQISTNHLNAQLTSHWKNAQDCVKSSSDDLLDMEVKEYNECRHIRALAQFQYFGTAAANPRPIDYFFTATFGTPSIKFLCNHEAIVFLSVTEGQINLGYEDSTKVNTKVDWNKNKEIRDIHAAFQVSFSRKHLKGYNPLDESDITYVHTLTLDMKSAAVVSLTTGDTHSPIPSDAVDLKNALRFYLLEYLRFLTEAPTQYHIFLDLTGDRDYAIHPSVQDTKAFWATTVLGIDIKEINQWFLMQWRAAESKQGEHGPLYGVTSQLGSVTGAGYQYFTITFDAPEVKTLCGREGVLTFNIRKIVFSEENDFTGPNVLTFTSWKISLIIGVSKDESSQQIILKLEDAYHAQGLSSSNFSEHEDVYFKRIVQFMLSEYCETLIQRSLHRVTSDIEAFDQRLVMSSSSFDTHFIELPEEVTTCAEQEFLAKIRPITTSFLYVDGQDDRVIVTMVIRDVTVGVRGDTSTSFTLTSVTAAFEVPIISQENEKASAHQLGLDFDRSCFMEGLSHDLPPDEDQRRTFLDHIKAFLRKLSKAGHNIIYSAPIVRDSKKARSRFSTTGLYYKIISRTNVNVTVNNFKTVESKDTPTLFIGAVCGSKSMPVVSIRVIANWVAHMSRRRVAMISRIPKEVLFDDTIAPLWGEINAEMRLLPATIGRPKGKSKFAVTSWKEEYGDDDEVPSSKTNEQHNSREYIWSHSRNLQLTEDEETKNESVLSCITEHKLSIPLNPSDANGLMLELIGESGLAASITTDGLLWSKKTSAKWSISMHIRSDSREEDNLAVLIRGAQTIDIKEFDDGSDEVPYECDLRQLHGHSLPPQVNLDSMVQRLRNQIKTGGLDLSTLRGQKYHLVDLVLTKEGDLEVSFESSRHHK